MLFKLIPLTLAFQLPRIDNYRYGILRFCGGYVLIPCVLAQDEINGVDSFPFTIVPCLLFRKRRLSALPIGHDLAFTEKRAPRRC
jgi:hypothetical protein